MVILENKDHLRMLYHDLVYLVELHWNLDFVYLTVGWVPLFRYVYCCLFVMTLNIEDIITYHSMVVVKMMQLLMHMNEIFS
jgi:hypothetical protein